MKCCSLIAKPLVQSRVVGLFAALEHQHFEITHQVHCQTKVHDTSSTTTPWARLLIHPGHIFDHL